MRTVWKFDAPIADEFSVAMPRGAEMLTVQMQHGHPVIWALVDTVLEAEPETRHFSWRGTGHDCDYMKAKGYVGTVQISGGTLIFHLFERVA